MSFDLQPQPWPFFAATSACLLYGLWPALKPEHFRRTCLRYTPDRWRAFGAPADIVQLGGIVVVVMCGFALMVGIASRL